MIVQSYVDINISILF